MKKLAIVIMIMLTLCSCSESVQVDLLTFTKNLNKTFGYQIINNDTIISKSEKEECISYFVVKEYNLCCTIYSDNRTGTIKKYTIISKNDNQQLKYFEEKFSLTIQQRNKHIKKFVFETDGYITIIFEDTRYLKETTNATIKSEIDEITY